MSQQGPIIIVSTARRPSFASALDDAKLFPAFERSQRAALLPAWPDAAPPDFEALPKQIAARQPYLPLIAVDPRIRLPENAIPFSQSGGNFDRLMARLRAALRVRTLHSTVMRRLDDEPAARTTATDSDP